MIAREREVATIDYIGLVTASSAEVATIDYIGLVTAAMQTQLISTLQ